MKLLVKGDNQGCVTQLTTGKGTTRLSQAEINRVYEVAALWSPHQFFVWESRDTEDLQEADLASKEGHFCTYRPIQIFFIFTSTFKETIKTKFGLSFYQTPLRQHDILNESWLAPWDHSRDFKYKKEVVTIVPLHTKLNAIPLYSTFLPHATLLVFLLHPGFSGCLWTNCGDRRLPIGLLSQVMLNTSGIGSGT